MSKEIYLVHDDQEDPSTRIKFLEFAGYKVTVMQDAQRCLSMLENKVPSLILTDILVHGMTGFDFCLAIRQRFTPERLPVLLSSGIYKGSIYQEESRRVGAQGFMLAPVQLDELILKVNELTGGLDSQAA
ncbi:MAG: CheY-like chemotaxis protein [Candidatus Paceibacteria bacterium]|jgi:CheY-like chemotaxis protein